jgi:hypothetical protein
LLLILIRQIILLWHIQAISQKDSRRLCGGADMAIEQFPAAGFNNVAVTFGAECLMVAEIDHMSSGLKNDIFLKVILKIVNRCQL